MKNCGIVCLIVLQSSKILGQSKNKTEDKKGKCEGEMLFYIISPQCFLSVTFLVDLNFELELTFPVQYD